MFTVSVFIVFVWTEGLNASKCLRLLAFAFTIVFVWTGPKRLRRQLQGKHRINTELCVKSLAIILFITLYKIDGVHFRLLGTNGFHVKAKNERFTAASSRCRQNLKYENFPSSFGRLRQNTAPKSVPHVQHDYFSSFNQSNH